MDLATVLSDKALLRELSREYELLKATHATVDWEEWITARLKRAASRRCSNSTQHTAGGPLQDTKQQGALSRLPLRSCVSLRTPGRDKLPARMPLSTNACINTRTGDAAEEQQAPDPQPSDWQAHDVTNTTPSEVQQQQQELPSLIRLQPSSGTGVGTQVKLLDSAGGPQLPWVAAARLGSALQASKGVDTLHAASDRERRLAAAAAVARQTLDLGVSQDSVAAQLAAASSANVQQLQPGAQEQLQQVVKLTQEVVQQNQLLQQAMLRQQAQLSQHQGLLTTVLQQGSDASGSGLHALLAPAATAAAPAASSAQQAPVSATAGAGASGTPNNLPDQVKGSWLVQKLLGQQQQQPGGGASKSAAAGASTPEFIRIAGAGKQPPQGASVEQHTTADPTPHQQLAASSSSPGTAGSAAASASAAAAGGGGANAAGADGGDRRKQLKQVLRKLLSEGAVGPLPDGLAGLVEGLKGLLGATQAHSSTAEGAATAAAAAGGQQGQQQAGNSRSSTAAASLVALLQQQDQQQDQRTQLSKAQQLVLRRRRTQEAERQRLQQQQEQEAAVNSGGRPGWQSDVYVPPPARMLRAKKGVAADVWNAAPAGNDPPGSSPPQAARAATKAGQAKKGASKGQRRRPPGNTKGSARRGASSGGVVSRLPLNAVLHGGGWRADGGLRQRQLGRVSMPGGDEEARLARVEETTAQVLQAVARLEQRVGGQPQQQWPAQARSSTKAGGSAQYQGPVDCQQQQLQQQQPDELRSLLSALERVEQQEREIHSKWFGPGSSGGGSSSGSSGGGSNSSASSGVNTVAGMTVSPVVAAAGADMQQTGDKSSQPLVHQQQPQQLPPGSPQQHQPQQAAASGATAGAVSPYQALQEQEQQQQQEQQQEQQQQQQEQGEEQGCSLSDAAVRSILSSRRRFLRHQAKLDAALQDAAAPGTNSHRNHKSERSAGAGTAGAVAGLYGGVVDSSSGNQGRSGPRSVLQPGQVVEAVADLILDELLMSEAVGLEGLCDALCDQLVEDEFL